MTPKRFSRSQAKHPGKGLHTQRIMCNWGMLSENPRKPQISEQEHGSCQHRAFQQVKCVPVSTFTMMSEKITNSILWHALGRTMNLEGRIASWAKNKVGKLVYFPTETIGIRTGLLPSRSAIIGLQGDLLIVLLFFTLASQGKYLNPSIEGVGSVKKLFC